MLLFVGDRLPTFVTTHQRARRLAWSRRAVIGLCAVLLIGLSLPAATAPALSPDADKHCGVLLLAHP